jgi:hypothetical protein
MISIKIVGAIALLTGAMVGCGGSDGPPAGAASGAGGSDVTAVVTPEVCGAQGQRCCTTGTLCASGLSCSDEYCLRCGAPPAPSSGCTNVARGGATTAGSFGTGAPDDSTKVVDGDVCTSWNYGSYADTGSRWQVDLGRSYDLEALTLWPKMTPAEGTVQFLIEHKAGESDGYVPWPTSGGLALTLYDYKPWQTTFSPAITARYFRITIQGTPSFAALREVALYTSCGQPSK